jgi:O-methyltransferase
MIDFFRKSLKRLVYRKHYVFFKSMPMLGRRRKLKVFEGDYIRLSSLELVADEINSLGIEGNVAELGVYRGDFAKWINEAFPDRKLYLFDTFEGFDERDIKIDRKKGYSLGEDEFQTSVTLVLKKMKYPDNCIVRKGWFPESARGISDKYVFVSIDVDLYQPIYEGLEFFYPRLVRGGYIFVHDYNSEKYAGVKVAVREFCTKNKIPFFPLTDRTGSAIIPK